MPPTRSFAVAHAALDSSTPGLITEAEDVSANAEVPFEAGDAVFEQSETVCRLLTAGGAPLTYLILTVFPQRRGDGRLRWVDVYEMLCVRVTLSGMTRRANWTRWSIYRAERVGLCDVARSRPAAGSD